MVAQFGLLVAFVLLPVYRPPGLHLPFYALYAALSVTLVVEFGAVFLLARGITELGQSLTPLPYPRDDGELVQTGVYRVIRHPLYGGLILAALGWTILQVSLSHLAGTIALFLFFDAKASREENWLVEKYPDYAEYRQQVKKLIPWMY